MKPPQHEDDLFDFAEDDQATLQDTDQGTWRILVVDDDQDVHEATRFALKNQKILGKNLEIYSAYTGHDAQTMLQKSEQFACILLDVVMETPDAGLKLVSYIREELREDTTRIILRTGQPGYAPESQVIERYDINDYKAKDELTRNRLITTLTSSIRSYQQIKTIKANKEGLAMIINGAPTLFRERAIGTFAKGVLLQLCSLLQIEKSGFLCCCEDLHHDIKVLAAYGQYKAMSGSILNSSEYPDIVSEIKQVIQSQQRLIGEDYVILHMRSPYSDNLIVKVDTHKHLSETDLHLLSLFSVSISVGFDNARLFERMENLAYIDPLTKLPNRTGYIYELTQHIHQQTPFYLVLADIDNFQAINDGLGYQVGNATLVAMAEHLPAQLGDNSMIGRISADTFCVMIPDSNREYIHDKLMKLELSLAESFNIDGYEIPLSLTMGLVHFPEHGSEAETLLQNASIALKHAKKTNRAGFSEFGHEYEQQLQHRLHMAAELRHCVERNELKLMFQAQICLSTMNVIGAEALVRWHHQGCTVPPNDFISTAESSGYIVPMGYWILEEACKQQVNWLQQTGEEIVVAVNVSVRQLKDPHFIKRMDEILHETGINTSSLEVEITESMMMEDSDGLTAILHQIRQRGVKVALDDFGTGYSSLSYLQQLPISHLKIDRSFINKITGNKEDRAITALMVRMGELLNMKVIAEGVESPEQQQELIRLGCHEAQGYLYSKPLLSEDFIDFLLQVNGQVLS